MSKLKITVQRLSEIEMRINESEQYQCRLNLRLHGNSEEKQEDIKAKDGDICCAVVRENQMNITENIDITHHLCCLNDQQRVREQLSSVSPTKHPWTWCGEWRRPAASSKKTS
ncbi:hypothetical protein ILYODFUR_026237 [Ilyodon furcidens]|uniref:Uncharacterized protein n=1 Tax=Ilyodon furcidens TaxID=33524 RepID=A0ABV0UL37_9TELE